MGKDARLWRILRPVADQPGVSERFPTSEQGLNANGASTLNKKKNK
jgi:hypothetical protein